MCDVIGCHRFEVTHEMEVPGFQKHNLFIMAAEMLANRLRMAKLLIKRQSFRYCTLRTTDLTEV